MKKQREGNPCIAALFLAYGAMMLYLLFIRNRSVVDGAYYWEQVENYYNLNFLRTVGNYWDVRARPDYYIDKWEGYAVYSFQARIAVINILGNVAMFVPFGLLLPMRFPSLRKLWKAFPVAVTMIVLVEILQLFSLRGKCDVDDLFLNAVGILLGYGLWWIYRIRKNKGNGKGV